MRLGLRLQIILALTVAFVLSFALLGAAAVELARRGRILDEQRAAESAAATLALASQQGRHRFREHAQVLMDRGAIRGAELSRGDISEVGVGSLTGRSIEGSVGSLTLVVYIGQRESGRDVSDLFLLYVAVTGGAILMLSYVSLTYLIVRPVERLRRASEQLAAGKLNAKVEPKGAAEVVGLAVSFNAMSEQLRQDRVELEAQLKELTETTEELRSAQQQVIRGAKLASVGRLAAGVAHEIGNPLTAILGLIELVQSGDLEVSEEREFLGRIEGETVRIHRIIRDLLDYARQEDGLRIERVDIGEVIERAVGLVAPQKDLHKVTIERRLREVPYAAANTDQLEQVVLNLLLNAADAIEGEGSVLLESDEDGEHVIIRVSDSGPGIDETVRDSLFEPFVTTKSTGDGTGLGLAVCYSIVESFKGEITVDEGALGGASFEIRLPRFAARDEEAETEEDRS